MKNKFEINDQVKIASHQTKYLQIFGTGTFTVAAYKPNALTGEYCYTITSQTGQPARGIPERVLTYAALDWEDDTTGYVEHIACEVQAKYGVERKLIRIVRGHAVTDGISPFTYVLRPGDILDLVRVDKSLLTDLSNLSHRQQQVLNRQEPWLVLRDSLELVGMPESVWQADKVFDIKAKMVVKPTPTEGYQQNKTARFCVRCNCPTVEKALFTGVIRYCSCTEELT